MKIKLFNSNVWADVFGNPVEPRDSLLADIIADYSPDILFFEEMHPHWHEGKLKPRLYELGYVESRPDLNGKALNYTPVFYNADRFDEIRSGFHLYTGPNDFDSKSYSLSCLREKKTGVKIGALATHFWFMWDESGQIAREMNAKELIEAFDSLTDCAAVFCGGDFNCDEHSSPFEIMRKAGIVTASTLAEKKKNFICTWHGDPIYDADSGKYTPADVSTKPNDLSLDHIVVRGSAVIRSYEVISDERARIVSDHCPVMIEAEIK